eukprot:TRINITY_DN9474_c0_g1_i4.p1 TRINITY_DN9474_c0_g1~~TRINITY_DN9474_c0_g1_i4.p1  ORF type:complete len:753 (-),score=171.28 TRINITY_DN9474_c0_g1_i4:1171-3429(-)
MWVDGQMNGQGSMYYPNGNIFVGTWVNGQKEGPGSFVWNDGRKFNGNYAAGKPNGFGTFMNALGERYEGNYVDGKKHGKGQYHFQDNSVYDGDWENNFMHGMGTMIYFDGTRYEGEWTRDVRGEKGKFFWPNGDVFDGVFATDGEFVGGVIQYGNGNRYEGEVFNGKRNGVGVMFWVIGERFDGHWKNGKRHGFGTMYLLDGRVTDGHYEDDRCVNLTIREKKEDDSDRPSAFLSLDAANISRKSVAVFRDASMSILKHREGAEELSASPPMSVENVLTPLEVVIDEPVAPKCAADVDMDLERNINFDKIDQKGLAEDLITSTEEGLVIDRSSVPKTLNLAGRGKAKNERAKGAKKGFESSLGSTASSKHEDKNESGDETSGTDEEDEKRASSPDASSATHIGRNSSLDHLVTLTDNGMTFERVSSTGEVIHELIHTAPAQLVQETMIQSSLAPKKPAFTIIEEADEKKPNDVEPIVNSVVVVDEAPSTTEHPNPVIELPEPVISPVAEVSRPIETKIEPVLPIETKCEPDEVKPNVEKPEEPPVSDQAHVQEPLSKPDAVQPSIAVVKPAEVSPPPEPIHSLPTAIVDAEPERKVIHSEPAPSPQSRESIKPAEKVRASSPRISEIKSGDLEYIRITDWTVDHVCLWLESNNFKNFVPFFREKNWDGQFVDRLELNSFAEFGSKISLIQKRNLVFTVEQLRSRQKTRGSHLSSFASASEEEKDPVSPSGGAVVNVSKLRLFWERNATLDLK